MHVSGRTGLTILGLALVAGGASGLVHVPVDVAHLSHLSHLPSLVHAHVDAHPLALGEDFRSALDSAGVLLADAAEAAKGPGPWQLFRGTVEKSLVKVHDVLHDQFGVQAAYGWAIILFTCFVKALLLPLTYSQLESTQKVQALAPLQEEIKKKYANDQSKQQQMLAALFAETQVNPLAGCIPSLVQIPVFIALYRSLLRLSAGGQLDESWLWVPSLNGPQFGYDPGTTLDWLTKGWANGAPALGWHDTALYLVLPALLFLTQSISIRLQSPPTNGDPQMEQTDRILKLLPLLITYFAMNAPAGLGVYWMTNNVITTVTSLSIKEYFKRNPVQFENVDLDTLANTAQTIMGGTSYDSYLQQRSTFLDEALVHPMPPRPRRNV